MIGRGAAGSAGEEPPGEEPPGEAEAALEVRARRSAGGPLPDVSVLGLDDQRRGAPRWHRDPATGR
ncbi:hypothetical protein [Frankia sp. QA3]|uniref:hypothetical protein n=1 Tax=Frankia sp. QA3 TaxID=710111 RepID=UPI0006841554|nr:hypothetical protein [Frankia sp. QA3]